MLAELFAVTMEKIVTMSCYPESVLSSGRHYQPTAHTNNDLYG